LKRMCWRRYGASYGSKRTQWCLK